MSWKDDEELVERFWSKVDKSGGEGACWEWKACCDNYGYGQFNVGCKNRGAHRVAWVLLREPILEGLCVCHHCDNRKCVNPSHLFLGTRIENNRDRDLKGRQAKGEAVAVHIRGGKHGQSKLKESDIPKIRDFRKEGLTQKKIAKLFGVSQFTIYTVLSGKGWRHVA